MRRPPFAHWSGTPRGEWVDYEVYHQVVEELRKVQPDSPLLKSLGELDGDD